MSWIVVTLKPNQSKIAEENLINQELEAYFPKITYPYNERLITKYLFPGYGFIRITKQEELVCINYTKGISRILRINDSIPKLPDKLIRNIRDQVTSLNSQLAIRNTFKKNDKVILKISVLKNQEAEVISLHNRKDSQKVLLKILNSSNVVWIDSKYVELKPGFVA